MANSNLYGEYLIIDNYLVRDKLKSYYNKYKDNNPEILKHIIEKKDNKPEFSLSYSYAKKIKNYFENKENLNNIEELEKRGGWEFKNYLDKLLKNKRDRINQTKDIKTNIGGIDNQYIKPHNKLGSGRRDTSNLTIHKKQDMIKENDNKPKEVSICVLLNKDKDILILKRSDKENWMPRKFGLIGGGVDKGETPIEAVKREIKEEGGIDVGDNVKYVLTKNNGKMDVHIFIGLSPTNDIKLSDEHTEYKWIKPEELKDIEGIPTLSDDITNTLKKFKEEN